MILHGRLKVIVLQILSHKELTGNGIRSEIEKLTGSWKPSPGSIYPLLSKLSDDGFIKFEKVKNQKIYSITKKGRDLSKSMMKIKEGFSKNLSCAANIMGEVDAKIKTCLFKIKSKLDNCKHTMLPNQFELESLEGIIYQKNGTKEKQIKIDKIISEARKKIGQL